MSLDRSEKASQPLLADLRSDKNMDWIPSSDMWFSYLKIDTTAGDLQHDLAIDATGVGDPSPVAAGLRAPLRLPDIEDGPARFFPWLIAICAGVVVLGISRYVWDRA